MLDESRKTRYNKDAQLVSCPLILSQIVEKARAVYVLCGFFLFARKKFFIFFSEKVLTNKKCCSIIKTVKGDTQTRKGDTKMKRFEVVANKGNDVIYKNCKENEMMAVLLDWELRMKGYESKIVKQEW